MSAAPIADSPPARLELSPSQEFEKVMTQHRSLKSVNKIVVKRNVLKRFERVDVLRDQGKWKDGDRAFGLPKTKPPM